MAQGSEAAADDGDDDSQNSMRMLIDAAKADVALDEDGGDGDG